MMEKENELTWMGQLEESKRRRKRLIIDILRWIGVLPGAIATYIIAAFLLNLWIRLLIYFDVQPWIGVVIFQIICWGASATCAVAAGALIAPHFHMRVGAILAMMMTILHVAIALFWFDLGWGTVICGSKIIGGWMGLLAISETMPVLMEESKKDKGFKEYI